MCGEASRLLADELCKSGTEQGHPGRHPGSPAGLGRGKCLGNEGDLEGCCQKVAERAHEDGGRDPQLRRVGCKRPGSTVSQWRIAQAFGCSVSIAVGSGHSDGGSSEAIRLDVGQRTGHHGGGPCVLKTLFLPRSRHP